MTVQDVAILYRHFPYPLEHIRGTLAWSGPRVTVDLETVVGGKPLTARGTIRNPGREAVVDLTFTAGLMPVDDVLFGALMPDVRKVVQDFRPEGSVHGTATLHRDPPPPGGDAKGIVQVHAELDLNPGCALTWVSLPYPVRNLTGHLSLHPESWVFTDMKGENNRARISASGRVDRAPGGKPSVDIALTAEHLPLDPQLRDALPGEWKRTWGILRPTGQAAVNAHIVLKPGQRDDYKFQILPEPDTRIHLLLTPAPGTATAGRDGVIELPPMEVQEGVFSFDNGLVTMTDVGFTFHQAPVRFGSGSVRLEDSGRFRLHADDLEVTRLRLDSDLRKSMPPVMAAFARRLDDGKTFDARGDLDISWSGQPGAPAVCAWDRARVVFVDNTVSAGLPLEHIQGEVRDVSGWSDGRSLVVNKGILDLASVNLLGQQVTRVSSPLSVGDGRAELKDIKASLLGGTIFGHVGVTLDATPRYDVYLNVVGARLEEYARTVPGHQEYRGEVFGEVGFTGLGQDLKTLKGRGKAEVVRGDLGKLPILFQLAQLLKLNGRGMFEGASAAFTIENGEVDLDPIKIKSNAVSLQGLGHDQPSGDAGYPAGPGRRQGREVPRPGDLGPGEDPRRGARGHPRDGTGHVPPTQAPAPAQGRPGRRAGRQEDGRPGRRPAVIADFGPGRGPTRVACPRRRGHVFGPATRSRRAVSC